MKPTRLRRRPPRTSQPAAPVAARPREIVLGVTGSIAAYKACDLVRRLREAGHGVSVVLTHEAAQFITPLSLQVLSGRRVHAEMFEHAPTVEIAHTTLAEHADLILIAPATANVIAKLAHGLADDVLTCTVLATHAPVLVVPAMNVHMYRHPMTKTNLATLRRLRYHLLEPAVGQLACGYEGIGHLPEVETIVQAAQRLLA